MPSKPVHYGPSSQAEPVIHELPAMHHGGEDVVVRLEVRRVGDGTWRARLLFGTGESEAVLATAEIFCAQTETDLWQAVRDLRDHHYRDLYRSVAE